MIKQEKALIWLIWHNAKMSGARGRTFGLRLYESLKILNNNTFKHVFFVLKIASFYNFEVVHCFLQEKLRGQIW